MIQGSFCYNGQEFGVVEEDTIVQLAGNSLVLWNATTGHKDYIECPRATGFSCFATNSMKNLIAVAEYGLKPKCYIHHCPSRQVFCQFQMDTTLKAQGMAFSRDGKYLVILGGLPDFRISIFDLDKGQLIEMPQTTVKTKEEIISVSFNPKTKSEFCILTASFIHFYRLLPAFRVVKEQNNMENESENGEGYELIDAYRLEQRDFNVANIPIPANHGEEVHMTSLKWDPFGRVHLCTNTRNLYQINPLLGPANRNDVPDKKLPEPKVEQVLELQSVPLTTVLTQKHMIIAHQDGIINWYNIEMPVYEENNPEQCIKLEQKIDKEYLFLEQLGESKGEEFNCYANYSKSFQKLIIGTNKGVLAILPVKAETIDFGEEDDEEQGEKTKQILQEPLKVLGKFHTDKVLSIRELGRSTQFATISQDQTLAIWEATNGKQIAAKKFESVPKSLEAARDGKAIFIGSECGIFRAYDVSNRKNLRLVKQLKFYFDKPIDGISTSADGRLIVLSCSKSNKVWFMSQHSSQGFEIYGYAIANGYVLSCALTVYENVTYALCVLNNGTAQVLMAPHEAKKDRTKPFTENDTKAYIRKLDAKTEIAIATTSDGSAWFVAGQDYFLKKYTVFPCDKFVNIKWETPAVAANHLLDSHSLETTSYFFSEQHNLFASGGKDGRVLIRTISDLMSKQNHNNIQMEVNTHSVLNGGVSAICLSRLGQFVYSAGEDGSIFIHQLKSGQPYPTKEVVDSADGTPEIVKINTIQELQSEEIKYVIKIIEEEIDRANEDTKRKFKLEIMNELAKIQTKLHEILAENEKVVDIEKLERDEFVVDVERQLEFIELGENTCNEIKQDAEKETLKLQLLREIVQKNTYDTMEVQSKACKSILTDKLLFNFSLRKRRPEEERLYKQIVIQRKIELMEKQARAEKSIIEALNETEFSEELRKEKDKEGRLLPVESKEEYFMNRLRGKPSFIDDDAIMKVQLMIDAMQAAKEAERAKKNQGLQNVNDGSAKDKPILTITKGRLGNKTQKKEENAGYSAANAKQTVEIKGMEEIHWKISLLDQFRKQQAEDLRKSFEANSPYEYLYNTFELYTNKRKRSQIEVLKMVVFELKKDFNKEFLALENKKEDCKLQIKEKNENIRELLQNLKDFETEVKEVDSHILEHPELILEIDDSEVPGIRYLTKEERAIKEEEERKIREREEALKGDNVQQRGLKTMIGGNELNLKKDKNKNETTLEMEDWMLTKSVEQMNEDEKARFEDFKRRKKELEEKQQKAWKQQLNSLKNDVQIIKVKFEEELLSLYKKRLFYEASIYEQELYIIRLVIMLSEVKQKAENTQKFTEERMKLEAEFEEKDMHFKQVLEKLTEKNQQILTDNAIQKQDQDVNAWAHNQSLRQGMIKEFIKKGKKDARMQISDIEKKNLTSHIVALDPFCEIDKLEVNGVIKEKEEVENYQYERDKPGEVTKEQFEYCTDARQQRIKLNKLKEEADKRLNNLKDYKNYLEDIKTELFETSQNAANLALEEQQKAEMQKFNYEVIVFLRQGQVEVPQAPVTTDYMQAILIEQSVIQRENEKIKEHGEKKIKEMDAILKHKQELKKIELEQKKLTLMTKDFKERATDVQLYRVTKQTQEIIQGKHTKRDEEDKKRLEQQIKQLEENTLNRIKAVEKTKQKLKREIREKKAENEQLEQKARQLKLQADDRQSIIALQSKYQAEDASDPQKKCAEIAQQRKLLEVIQQQSEEMMFLKDELDRLRARTFPSFAHLQKPEYPDER